MVTTILARRNTSPTLHSQFSGRADARQPRSQSTTDSGHGCMALSQYAQIASGPAGGGSGAWQALQNQDYDAQFHTQVGAHMRSRSIRSSTTTHWTTIATRRGFHAASEPARPYCRLNNTYRTYGSRLSDDIATQANDFGFGVYTQHQTNIQLGAGFRPPYGGTNTNVFLRDAWTPPGQLSYFVNAWYKHYNANGDSSR